MPQLVSVEKLPRLPAPCIRAEMSMRSLPLSTGTMRRPRIFQGEQFHIRRMTHLAMETQSRRAAMMLPPVCSPYGQLASLCLGSGARL